MSVSFYCRCPERKKPVAQRNWGVSQRNCNHSAFNGYRWMYSDYSTVICLSCLTGGRTKAAFVGALPDLVLQNGDWVFKSPQPSRTKTAGVESTSQPAQDRRIFYR